MSQTVNQELAQTFLTQFTSAQQLKDWILVFFGLDMPMGHIDPDSNSSPIEWMYDAYSNYLNNKGNEVPGYIVLSSRDSYKTLSESMLAVILMAHFNCTIAHLAAIEQQASKAVQYVNSFIAKVKPYLEFHGKVVDTQSKRKVGITARDGNIAYINVIVATLQGCNSEHCNILSIDEIDVMRFPQAYEEAKFIPGMMNGQFPLTIKTSTRKFAFGLMQKEMDERDKSRERLLKWNIIDVTEKCQPQRHLPDLPKEIRYIAKRLPLKQISEEEYTLLIDEKKPDYDRIEVFAGCAKCPLLPVCKTRLATRPDSDVGGLYKPIDFTIGQFGKVSPDMAEAQLMCWKPSSTGLVYPRFDETEVTGNTLTISQAWEIFTGNEAPIGISLDMLIELFHQKGIKFYAGLDWGFRHYYSIIVSAKIPNGDFWIFETFAMGGLEFEDELKYAKVFRDKYKILKWFPDTAMPSSIKTFRKNKMPCKEFKKDVLGGIEAIRGQVVDATGKRKLKVIKTEENDFLIQGFKHHHFKLDAAGRPTKDPDDEEYADAMDALRYVGQNLFESKGGIRVGSGSEISEREARLRIQRQLMYQNNPNKIHAQFLTERINQLSQQPVDSKGKSESGTVIWDFSNPFDTDDS